MREKLRNLEKHSTFLNQLTKSVFMFGVERSWLIESLAKLHCGILKFLGVLDLPQPTEHSVP